jgi:hypothetical protein
VAYVDTLGELRKVLNGEIWSVDDVLPDELDGCITDGRRGVEHTSLDGMTKVLL